MPATPRGVRTERAFQDAARKVFAERGYFNTKISDIAEVAGRSPASFYNYYENKEALLAALLDRFTDEVVGEISHLTRGHDPEEAIAETVRIYWDRYREYLPEMIGVFQLSMVDENFARRWRENRMRGIRGVLEGIRKARKEGYGRDLDPEILASALVSAMEAFCWVWLAAGGDYIDAKVTDDTAVQTLAAMWHRTLYFPAKSGEQT